MAPLGPLVFFAQFLHAGGRWEDFCREAPFGFTSPNAPSHEDVLGSLALSLLCGHTRYAHVNALRLDTVTPPMLGMDNVEIEDSVRRNLKKLDQIEARRWQAMHLRATWERLLSVPWMLDIDTTVKTVFGRQEGAEVGYNPHKPGRPSHSYHTYWIARLRLCLDLEVRPGNQNSACHGMPGLRELIDSLPASWPPPTASGATATTEAKASWPNVKPGVFHTSSSCANPQKSKPNSPKPVRSCKACSQLRSSWAMPNAGSAFCCGFLRKLSPSHS